MPKTRIYNVDTLGNPVGPYSHVARVPAGADTLYIAGMLAAGETFEAQCAAVYGQIEKALQSAGADWGSVVQFTTFLVHSQDIAKFYRWREQNYPKMFPDGKYPPNTLLVIDRLVQEQFLIEIQTVAAV
ncbi:MAG TPA: RidA family protein [Burkholderiales bacterium]|nr:RidA family protein [Burkholderiales bacterium]